MVGVVPAHRPFSLRERGAESPMLASSYSAVPGLEAWVITLQEGKAKSTAGNPLDLLGKRAERSGCLVDQKGDLGLFEAEVDETVALVHGVATEALS